MLSEGRYKSAPEAEFLHCARNSSGSRSTTSVSKPLMEKKRRARINKCLDQLKSLLENYYTSNIRKRKLEKADILELTVKHLRNLQKIQSGAPCLDRLYAEYQAGFRSCLAGVNQYLQDNSSGSSSRLTMLTHLSSSLRLPSIVGNKCLSNGQHSHAVTMHNVWRPW
uniref:Hairy-related 3 n=1 Tax=Oncorhynchus kisutch TaxID=8019 RepID=A0A8C7GQJ8_ONCKI